MLGFVELFGRLLSELHRAWPMPVCPGDWAWTATVAGALFGLLPMLGAMAAATVRHWTGNRYDLVGVVLFGALGFVMVGLAPLLSFAATSEVFGAAVRAEPVGLTGNDLTSLREAFCLDGQVQGDYLGAAQPVRAAVADLPAAGLRGTLAALVAIGAPLLALLFVYVQARVAFRRGPRWPARVFWLPVLLLVFGTAPLSVTTVAHLWLGFVPATVAGVFGVLLVGAPRWSVINASSREPRPAAGYPPTGGYPPAGPPQPLRSQPAPATWLPPHAQPAPGLPAGHPQQPTRVEPMPAEMPAVPSPTEPSQARPSLPAGGQPRLAADPGPLPLTLQQALAARSAEQAPDDGESAVEQTARLPSSRFQRIRRLGAGGFGQVWLAMDTTLGRTVAVKVATAHNQETQQRIQREARALAAVHHPNCVRIFDIIDDLDGGGLAIVMEYVPGRSLADQVTEQRYSDAQAARLWHTLAGALQAAHKEGVLHRDVKPSNIIIGDRGEPRLIDFGIARATGDATLTAAGLVIGTPDFLPPEIAAGRPPSPASDAWQLAAVVSFALTGIPPRGHSEGAIAAMLAAARGEPCNQLPTTSAHLPLLERALAPDPAQRPTLPAVQAQLSGWLR